MESKFVPQVDLCGDDTLSVAIDDSIGRHYVAEHLHNTGAWLECVVGMQSVVVRFDSATMSVDTAQQQLREQLGTVSQYDTDGDSKLIEIPVCYGQEYGPDLDSVCQMLGLTVDELIELHTSVGNRFSVIMKRQRLFKIFFFHRLPFP